MVLNLLKEKFFMLALNGISKIKLKLLSLLDMSLNILPIIMGRYLYAPL